MALYTFLSPPRGVRQTKSNFDDGPPRRCPLTVLYPIWYLARSLQIREDEKDAIALFQTVVGSKVNKGKVVQYCHRSRALERRKI